MIKYTWWNLVKKQWSVKNELEWLLSSTFVSVIIGGFHSYIIDYTTTEVSHWEVFFTIAGIYTVFWYGVCFTVRFVLMHCMNIFIMWTIKKCPDEDTVEEAKGLYRKMIKEE